MIRGPCDYVPPVKVNVVAERKAISLDESEGIYIRDLKSGKVKTCLVVLSPYKSVSVRDAIIDSWIPHK